MAEKATTQQSFVEAEAAAPEPSPEEAPAPPPPAPSSSKSPKSESALIRATFRKAPKVVEDALIATLGVAAGGTVLDLPAAEGQARIASVFLDWAADLSATYRQKGKVTPAALQKALAQLAADQRVDFESLFYGRRALPTLAVMLREYAGNGDIFSLQAGAAEMRQS